MKGKTSINESAAAGGDIVTKKRHAAEAEDEASFHAGHRQRIKERFRKYGLDNFADHEILELLLYYAIPRQDTNVIAHRLLKRFGSLNAVLSASVSALLSVEGMGENAATLITMLLPLYRRMQINAAARPTILNSPERMGAYFLQLFFGKNTESLYEACLDAKGKLLSCHHVADGGPDMLTANIRTIAENALAVAASAVILAHNHPSGIALASQEDVSMTRHTASALEEIGVRLVDHIIVADGDFVSLRDSGCIR